MNPDNFTPAPDPVKWPATKYLYELSGKTPEGFATLFDHWWGRHQADHTGFYRWPTGQGYGFRRSLATPSLWIELLHADGVLSVTVAHVTVARPFWAEGDITNHSWARADLAAIEPTERLCSAVRAWIEATYHVTAQVEDEPGTQAPEEQPQPPQPPEEQPPQPAQPLGDRKQAGRELDTANRWLIDQFFDVHQEKKRLPYFRDEWLKLRSGDGKPEPTDVADSMRQVIAAERKRRHE